MLDLLRRWLDHRKQIRRRWKSDAARLIRLDEPGAYYAAQRFAARSRAAGDRAEFYHWAKVAAEVARRSPIAEMDLAVVERIAAEELDKNGQG